MADTKISALTASTVPLAGTEVLPIVQSGTTKQVSVANLTAGRSVSMSNAVIASSGSSPQLSLTRTGISGLDVYFDNSGALIAPTTVDAIQIYDKTVTSRKFILNTSTADFQLNGNVVIGTSGKGIDFSATPGTGTSELFSDYEEGTWTPTQGAELTVIGTFSSNGTYTKVGRLVTIRGVLLATTSMSCTSAGVMCGGLPFAASADTAGVYFNGTLAAGGMVDANSTNINAVGAIASTNGIYISATYQV